MQRFSVFLRKNKEYSFAWRIETRFDEWWDTDTGRYKYLHAHTDMLTHSLPFLSLSYTHVR